MSLPVRTLSDPLVRGTMLHPDDLERPLTLDYELGGIAISDASQGMMVQTWRLEYRGSDAILTPANGGDITLFSLIGVTEISLAFDQNMRPFVAYMKDGEAWYYWWDPLAVDYEHTALEAGVTSPKCCLDDKRPLHVNTSDILLVYVRDEKLFYREQRDRYGVAYQLATGITSALYRIGMGDNLRIHFNFTDDALIPPPDITPVEMVPPYWDNLSHHYIDFNKTTIQSFVTTFGVTIEGDDFTNVFAIGNPTTPIATSINTADSGNQFSFASNVGMSEAVMLLVDDSGTVLKRLHYRGTASNEFITVPNGADYYLVTQSDTGFGTIRKYDSIGNTTPVDPPDPPVDPTGSTPYLEYFGVEFLAGPLDDMMKIVPPEGVFILFIVPMVTEVYHGLFSTISNTSISTTRTGAINKVVGDFTTPPVYTWGLGSGISYNINDAGYGDIDLIPGETYIFNVKNDYPTNANWLRIQHIWRIE